MINNCFPPTVACSSKTNLAYIFIESNLLISKENLFQRKKKLDTKAIHFIGLNRIYDPPVVKNGSKISKRLQYIW